MVSVDVYVSDQVDNLVKATVDWFGRISILINWAAYIYVDDAVAPGPILTASGHDLLWSDTDLQAKMLAQVALGRFGEPAEVATP